MYVGAHWLTYWLCRTDLHRKHNVYVGTQWLTYWLTQKAQCVLRGTMTDLLSSTENTMCMHGHTYWLTDLHRKHSVYLRPHWLTNWLTQKALYTYVRAHSLTYWLTQKASCVCRGTPTDLLKVYTENTMCMYGHNDWYYWLTQKAQCACRAHWLT